MDFVIASFFFWTGKGTMNALKDTHKNNNLVKLRGPPRNLTFIIKFPGMSSAS